MRGDLHTRSFCSDGTDSPASLVRRAVAAGLDVLALTDHESVAGWDEAQLAADDAGIALLRMEVSCRHRGAGGVVGQFESGGAS